MIHSDTSYTIHVSYARKVQWSCSPSNSSATLTKRALLPAGRPQSHRLLPAPGEKHQKITKDHHRACKIMKPRLQSASYTFLQFCSHILPFSCFASDLSILSTLLGACHLCNQWPFTQPFVRFWMCCQQYKNSWVCFSAHPIMSGMSASSKPTACQLNVSGISHRYSHRFCCRWQ